jgi:uncharacterized protein (TIGR02588 family)
VKGPKSIAPRPLLQWIAAGVGVCVTVGAAAVILTEALQPVRPVALSVAVEGVRQAGSNRIFELKVSNAGSETAAGVEIVGEDGAGRTASVTLDYVPGDGEASAAVSFPLDGTGGMPDFSVVGWSEP